MKKLKKIASVALALVMAMALMVPAFAAGEGTITVSNATIGEDYSIYKIFSATYSGENAAYTIKSTDPWYNLVNGEGSPFALTQIGSTGEYNVAKATGKTDADVITWLNGIETLPAATATQEEVKTVEVEFKNVDYGYYLVKSSLNGGGTLTVNNATPNATVIDKNQLPGSGDNDGKKVITIDGTTVTNTTDKSAEIGDEMEFQITYTATNYNGPKQITNYKIEDDMPNGFDLKDGTIAVKVGNKTLTLDTDYSIDYGATDADDFTVNIPWVDNNNASKYDSPVEIVVTYTAIMNADAAVDGTGNTNTAKITYTDADGDHSNPDTDTKTETVYTYALALKKVNKDGEPLAGATFTLKQGDTEVKVSGANGTYKVDPNGTASIVSPESGLIVITGLKNVDYTLTETVAPTGYNVLTAPETVKPVKTGATTTTVTKYLDADGKEVAEPTTETVEVEVNANVGATAMVVVNYTGAVLPSTGGMGTTLFYAIGGVLLAGSAILFVTKKRMGE